ncbi:hypothetical protein IQ07DRAFT_585847, partial [Pyrenochaeta sp. DS3sAY3a]
MATASPLGAACHSWLSLLVLGGRAVDSRTRCTLTSVGKSSAQARRRRNYASQNPFSSRLEELAASSLRWNPTRWNRNERFSRLYACV